MARDERDWDDVTEPHLRPMLNGETYEQYLEAARQLSRESEGDPRPVQQAERTREYFAARGRLGS